MNICIAFLFFTAFLLFYSSNGLECYKHRVNDPRYNSSEPNIEVCSVYHGSAYTDFCATITFKNGEIPDRECGDEEFCTEKGCTSSYYCKEEGTFEQDFPGIENVKFTIACCQEDLCNVENETTESTACKINSSYLVCIFVFNFFVFLHFVVN